MRSVSQTSAFAIASQWTSTYRESDNNKLASAPSRKPPGRRNPVNLKQNDIALNHIEGRKSFHLE